jgi:hypothetical protein
MTLASQVDMLVSGPSSESKLQIGPSAKHRGSTFHTWALSLQFSGLLGDPCCLRSKSNSIQDKIAMRWLVSSATIGTWCTICFHHAVSTVGSRLTCCICRYDQMSRGASSVIFYLIGWQKLDQTWPRNGEDYGIYKTCCEVKYLLASGKLSSHPQ